MEESSEESKKLFKKICYTERQVKNILKKQNIDWLNFTKWMMGQTGMLLVKNQKQIFGYYKSDVDRFLSMCNYKKER